MSSVTAVPHTWDLDTIAKVRRLYSEAHIDKVLIAADEANVLEVTCDRMARHFIENARALAVEVDAGDLQFDRDEPGSIPFTVRIRARWGPTTNAVELRGGQAGGQVVAVRRVGDSLRVPVERPFDWRTAGPRDFAPSRDILKYELRGWSESDRRWVYEMQP